MSASLRPPGSPPSRMTVSEFLDWPEDPTGARWQLVDGEPTLMAPASDVHGTIQSALAILLGNHLRQARPGCRVVTNPGIRPRVRRDYNVRIPDLAVTCVRARPGTHLMPDPILAIEILSISNQAETWSNVWTYCTITTLREILVVRSTEMAAEILRRNADDSWPERFEPLGALIELQSIGASFPLVDAYEGIDIADA